MFETVRESEQEGESKMKKTIIALAVIALVAPLAFGQEVLSRNAVGYVKVTAPKGKFTLVSMDFVDMGGGKTASDILGDQLPAGSTVSMSAQSPLRR